MQNQTTTTTCPGTTKAASPPPDCSAADDYDLEIGAVYKHRERELVGVLCAIDAESGIIAIRLSKSLRWVGGLQEMKAEWEPLPNAEVRDVAPTQPPQERLSND